MTEQIEIRVKTFASLRQVLGAPNLTVSVPHGSTVADVVNVLDQDYPAAAPHLARAVVAVNQSYASRDHVLAADDEVALFPPVSGGSVESVAQNEAVTYIAMSADPITPNQLSQLVTEPSIGAVVTFAGVVRDHNLGRQVRHLEYETYSEMAEARLRQIVTEARERWPEIRGVAVVHRVGHLEIGEMAVLVAVGAPHRDDGAFEAARYIIDRTKEIVPIWKKEVWADGEEWLEGDYLPQPGE